MTPVPFNGWAGPRKPKLLIVGEAWGENEWQVKQPFVGSSGILLWEILGQAIPDVEPELHKACLRQAYTIGNAWVRARHKWLEAAGIAYTNVLNFQPPGNRIESLCCAKAQLPPEGYGRPALAKGLYLRAEYLPEVDRLLSELDQSRPNCIVAAGNTASWALLRTTSISAIRGAATISATDPAYKVIPAYHPAAILRQWAWRPVTVADIIKAYKESETPELTRPVRHITINPDVHELHEWVTEFRNWDPPALAIDIETQFKMIKCIGFAYSRQGALVIPLIDTTKPGYSYWPTFEREREAWYVIKEILESDVPKLFQNGLYDLQYLIRSGFRPKNVLEDTMLLHHSLFPEMRKGLGFLGSIYTNEAAWKLMGRPKADTVKRDE